MAPRLPAAGRGALGAWLLTIGEPFTGGTASFVVAAEGSGGRGLL